MERIILSIALIFCAWCLWLLLRHDWMRWTRPMREAQAIVIGQRTGWSDSSRAYAARLQFQAEGRQHEVIDQLYGSKPAMADGERCRIMWPDGRPDLARIPRPWMWTGVYGILLYLAFILAGRLTGFID